MPVLILAPDRAVDENVVPFQTANGKRYIADEKIIRRYLSQQYGLPEAG
ncbi:hypothetical protein ACFPN2_26070 [Steroidobacter flavus]|uniref:Uncharacterized protein n=1 Tax=Steroidobacter flavus TaxID=1842136 RepID=A0ABV8SYL4_9GAMM